MKNRTEIILIGGATGTGKSSISFKIMKKNNIIHKIGTGFIREMSKCFFTKKKYLEVYKHSFETNNKNKFDNLYLQSKYIKSMIKKSINRAYKEGTSIIIEGVNIIPGLMEFNCVTQKIIMVVENEKKHFKRIFQNTTHTKRKIAKSDFKKIRSIQKILMEKAKKYNWDINEI